RRFLRGWGNEQHAERTGPPGRQSAAEGSRHERPRNRGQDAAAVDRAQRGRRAAVRESDERPKAVRDDLVVRVAPEASDEANPAGMVLHGAAFIAAAVG